MFRKDISISKILLLIFLSFVLVTMFSGFSFAQTVLLNQVPNLVGYINSNSPGTYQVADNFHLSNSATISQITIWGTYRGSPLPPLTDSFTVIFRADAAGIPGSIISTETNVPVSRQPTGRTFPDTSIEYAFTLTLATPVALSTGTYWVEIYDNTTATFFWETGNLDTSHGILHGAQYNSVSWDSIDDDLAIQMTGSSATTSIPTMTQWGMIIFIVLAGLGAVYYLRRMPRAHS